MEGQGECLGDLFLCLVGLGLWSYPNPLRGLVGGLGPLPLSLPLIGRSVPRFNMFVTVL